jgi:1-acyl-sn-glycerol-3-phosphate acyltransferase
MALIAHRSGALIVPVAITGGYKLFGKTKVSYGQPIDPKAIIDPHSEDPLGQITEAVMTRIRELAEGRQ